MLDIFEPGDGTCGGVVGVWFQIELANDCSEELCISDILDMGFSQRLTDEDDVVDEADEASASGRILFGDD